MKKLLILVLCTLSSTVFAVDRGKTASVSDFTGDACSYAKITVSSSTASTFSSYSTSRGALTCINNDSSNAVYIGSSTAVVAQGSASFPLKAGSSIQFRSNSGVFGIAEIGVTSVIVYCLTEN